MVALNKYKLSKKYLMRFLCIINIILFQRNQHNNSDAFRNLRDNDFSFENLQHHYRLLPATKALQKKFDHNHLNHLMTVIDFVLLILQSSDRILI